MKKYDYIIAGAGAAGLSLAYHLNRSTLKGKSILLIDREVKNSNDRTWCFWEMGQNPFEEVVSQSWQKMLFHGTHFSSLLDLSPYQYKMIRSIDFYNHIKHSLASNPAIEWLQSDILSMIDSGTHVQVATSMGVYEAQWLFDSTYQPKLNLPQYHNLLQHFKGWEIETLLPVFDPATATFMDFRIDQYGEARFFYILPSSAHRALVEFTVFSDQLLAQETYEQELSKYLKEKLHIESYQIVHEEFGVIPMSDEPMTERPSARIVRIGTSGGYTKPSTGYTFLRIQQRTQAIVQALVESGRPFYRKASFGSRFKLYDSVLLNVMAKKRCEMKDVFTDLFSKNAPSTVLQFLDENTNLMQEWQILASVPRLPFLNAVTDLIRSKVVK